MAAHSSEDVTVLLRAWRNGDKEALDRLIPLIEEELRRLASYYLGKERRDHTLQTTALVHEAYIRLIDRRTGDGADDLPGDLPDDLKDRAHFFRLAARLMRNILVDHARKHSAMKRGGLAKRVSLEEAGALRDESAGDLSEIVAVDEVLEQFSARFPRQGQVVELRFFGGLTVEETAEALGVDRATVVRDWEFARTWLRQRIERQEGSDEQNG